MADDLLPALTHLTGARRGTTHPLTGEELLVGTSARAEVHLPADREPDVRPRHATLRRGEDGWRIAAGPGAAVFVNGERVDADRLLPGDVVQLGPDGPLLRFRLEPSGSGYKSLRDALADCVACARYGADALPARLGLLLRVMPGELFGRTSPWTRALVVGAVAAVLAGTGYQLLQSRELGDRLTHTRARLEAVAESLRAERRGPRVTPALLDSLRRAAERRPPAGRDGPAILAGAARSVMFVLGSYGFEDPGTGRRVEVRRGGPGAAAGPVRPVPPGAGGEPLRRRYSGTAFAVTGRGHFVTNRHLVRPWRHDAVARTLEEAGFRPVFEELTGYLPGRSEPIGLEIVAESDSADLALLRAVGLEEAPPPLALGRDGAEVGEDVYLLGYPTGVRALLARSDPAFVAELRRDSVSRDPWRVTRRLAAEGAISPLTTRGIVGQVSPAAVVYDAETSQGGSGGPVLGPGGRVVAVNMGLMPEFGGSNLGVPVRHVRRLLERAGVER